MKIKFYKKTSEKELKENVKKIFKYIALNGGGGLYVHAYLNRHNHKRTKYVTLFYRCLYLKDEKSFHNFGDDYFLRTKINKEHFYMILKRTLEQAIEYDEVTIIY